MFKFESKNFGKRIRLQQLTIKRKKENIVTYAFGTVFPRTLDGNGRR